MHEGGFHVHSSGGCEGGCIINDCASMLPARQMPLNGQMAGACLCVYVCFVLEMEFRQLSLCKVRMTFGNFTKKAALNTNY